MNATMVLDENEYEATATTGGTAHTKGDWVELCSSVPLQADGMVITTRYANFGVGYTGLMDVGVGESGSQRVVAENLMEKCTNHYQNYFGDSFQIPVPFVQGNRVWVRCQSPTPSVNWTVSAYFYEHGQNRNLGIRGIKVHAIGANTSASMGTSVVPNGSAWVWGSWSELHSSSPVDCRALIVGVVRDTTTAACSDLLSYWQIGLGPATETPVIWGRNVSYSNDIGLPRYLEVYPMAIKAGTRITARVMNNTAVSQRDLSMIVYMVEG